MSAAIPHAPTRTDRRAVLLGAAVLAAVGLASTVHAVSSHAAGAERSGEADATWLTDLTGTHRQLFDSPAVNNGVVLIHMKNFYDTYNSAFGAPDSDINAIGTFYGATTFYGLNDAMWAKYKLGTVSETIDPTTNQPATANPWRTNPMVLGMRMPDASIEALQKRGATFLVCNNALGFFAQLIAKAQGLDAAVVLADFQANILPGVKLVPAMVVAIEQAQRDGISYHRQ